MQHWVKIELVYILVEVVLILTENDVPYVKFANFKLFLKPLFTKLKV